MYEYKARIIRVIDGDTLIASVDLGFAVHVEHTLRLDGIDAPEMDAQDPAVRAAAVAARSRLTTLLIGPAEVIVQTRADKHGVDRTDSFGRRYLARIIAPLGIVNDIMVAEGHAKKWSRT